MEDWSAQIAKMSSGNGIDAPVKLNTELKADEPVKQEQRDKEMRSASQTGDEREVCRNFLYKRCTRGSMCKFLHPMESAVGSEPPAPSRKRSRSPLNKDAAAVESSGERKDVCRDFARNLCSRGNQCKFFHPPVNEVEKHWFNVCLDFQNGKCRRWDCRYFHLRQEDEDQFRHTGELGDFVFTQSLRHALAFDGALDSSVPVCKNFLKSYCTANNCRFRHLPREEFEDEVYACLLKEVEQVYGPPNTRRGPGMHPPPRPPMSRGGPMYENEFEGPPPSGPHGPYYGDPPGGPPPPPHPEFERGPHPEEVVGLKRELSKLRLILDESRPEEYRSANAELKEKIRNMDTENARLLTDLKNRAPDPKLLELERNNQELLERYNKVKNDLLNLEGQKQSADQYKSFMNGKTDQLREMLRIFEAELFRMFRSGPPPPHSLTNAWDRMQANCNAVCNYKTGASAEDSFNERPSASFNGRPREEPYRPPAREEPAPYRAPTALEEPYRPLLREEPSSFRAPHAREEPYRPPPREEPTAYRAPPAREEPYRRAPLMQSGRGGNHSPPAPPGMPRWSEGPRNAAPPRRW